MNKTIAEARRVLRRLPGWREGAGSRSRLPAGDRARRRGRACDGGGTRVAAQNMHSEPSGAFTGELSAPMLAGVGCWGVILGHSERRGMFGETDEALAKKVPAALDAGLVPILCVGESEAERDGGETEAVLARQLDADLARARPAGWARWSSPTSRSGRSEPAGRRPTSRPRRRSRSSARGSRRSTPPRRRGPDPLRRLDEAGERRGAARPAGDRRRPRRRRLARPQDFVAICRAAQ